jgi:protein O-GlcNAc transferase
MEITETYQELIDKANSYISKTLNAKGKIEQQKFRRAAIDILDKLIKDIDIAQYLLINNDHRCLITKSKYLEICFVLGTLYKTYNEVYIEIKKIRCGNNKVELIITDIDLEYFNEAIKYLNNIINIKTQDEMASKQLISIYTQLCSHNSANHQICLKYLKDALYYNPTDETLNYNLGFIHQKLNNLYESIIHYKISISILEKLKTKDEGQTKLLINNYNGLASIYKSVQNWPTSLYYLQKAEEILNDDPDIQNQLGIVYTEMRRTDLAEIAYNKAITNYKKSFISGDSYNLLADIYLNMGHMCSYNGDNMQSIENYNKALVISPRFILPFQNKLMNLNYLFDQIDDKNYIYNQHCLINKLFANENELFKFDKTRFIDHNLNKINIGFVSGDFVNHPVSYFINSFLQNFDNTRFNVICYSETIIDKVINDVQFKSIKNTNAKTVGEMIYNDNIHILIDLSGHTAFNRLDVFALKPAPIQISYIGYPYSTGLAEMDYRITDNYCDKRDVSDSMYCEKLLYIDDCFLCYDVDKSLDCYKLNDIIQPYLYNKYLTIGCFNRLNKITTNVIKLYNDILLKYPNIRFVFKTKALLNNVVAKKFLNKFSENVRSRINILDCTISHNSHLLEYNNIDLAIDTFPYSGTTTSCEALSMGVPVITLYDDEHYFHAQNVTSSILYNSNLGEYVCKSQNEIFDRIEIILSNKNISFWQNFKRSIQKNFFNGKVCNKILYNKNITKLLKDVYTIHKLKLDA